MRKSENSAVSEVTKHPSVKDSVNFQESETYTFSICGLKAVPDWYNWKESHFEQVLFIEDLLLMVLKI